MQYSFALLGLVAVASAQEFTSIFNVTATPDQVISNAGASAPGPAGAKGQFNYAINSKTDTICYDITLVNFVGAYMSPAKTATHIHEGVEGKAGPPRIALPNPVGDDNLRYISGCLTGPFTTGLKMADNVTDTGAGFKLSQIEANPAGFFTDSHSALFPAGVVRGQLDQKFEIIKPKPVTTGYPTDGHEITTATYTMTVEHTITKCQEEVTDCPYKTNPVVTKTEEVYTTVCPKSELSTATLYSPVKTEKTDCETKTYTTEYPTHTTVYQTVTASKPGNVYETQTIKTEYPVQTTETEYEPSKPAETHPVSAPVSTIETYPVSNPPPFQTFPAAVGTGSLPPYATFTGAAASNKVGGLLIAAGLAAALM